MRIAAITTFSPSQNVLSTFGYQSIKSFLNISEVEEILVLCDQNNHNGERFKHNKVNIDRCWAPNSLLNIIKIATKVYKYHPDIVWISFQYTLFGPNLVSAFLGLFIIPVLRLMGYPVVTVLHNYYGAVNINKLGMQEEKANRWLIKFIDPVIMKAITSSNKIFVMAKEYLYDLKAKYPSADVEFIEQDMWDTPTYRQINRATKNILTFGYFGTYKKIEPLLDIFPKIQETFPSAQLIIAGKSHPHVPNYLNNLLSCSLENTGIIYKGYIKDDDLDEVFWNSNIVVLTNSVVTGSSTVLRFASCFGRGVIVPTVDEYNNLDEELWGVKKYKEGEKTQLLENILTVLSDENMQILLSQKNYNQAVLGKRTFLLAHTSVFKRIKYG